MTEKRGRAYDVQSAGIMKSQSRWWRAGRAGHRPRWLNCTEEGVGAVRVSEFAAFHVFCYNVHRSRDLDLTTPPRVHVR